MAILTVTPNYRPTPKQMLLHNAPISIEDIWIILFGGARATGKSAGILGDAFLFATTYPGAKCCILRENLDAVKQSFLDKLPGLFPQEVNGVRVYEYREKSTSWYPSRSIVFPNGSYITLQRVADYKEAFAKQGWEFNYLAVDEVTKQQEQSINYLLTTVRSVTKLNKYTGKTHTIPTKVVFGCNPGGPGHKWVKQRFIDPTVVEKNAMGTPIKTKDHMELVPDPLHKGKFIKRFIRFIPASYGDNPYLAPAYIANLMSQPEHMIQKDVYGNWDIVAGKMFEFNEEEHFIDFPIVRTMLENPYEQFDIYISIDWGFKPSFHSAQWHAVFQSGRVVTFKEMYGQDLIFEDFVKEIAKRSEGFHVSGTLLPHDMFRGGDRYRDDNGKIIGEMKSEVFDSFGLNAIGVASGKGKVQMRFDKIHSASRTVMPDGIMKFRISKNVSNLIEELENAVYDEFNPEMLNSSCRDHAIDAYGLFLVFYSEDIEPIGEYSTRIDTRSNLQKMIEAEEEMMDEIAEGYYIEDTWEY